MAVSAGRTHMAVSAGRIDVTCIGANTCGMVVSACGTMHFGRRNKEGGRRETNEAAGRRKRKKLEEGLVLGRRGEKEEEGGIIRDPSESF